MSSHPLIDRLAQGPLLEALSDNPVVLIHGPRQCGETMLAKATGILSATPRRSV